MATISRVALTVTLPFMGKKRLIELERYTLFREVRAIAESI